MRSEVLHCMTASDFLSCFCLSKVIGTHLAKFNSVDVQGNILLFWMKTKGRAVWFVFGRL
jgi:hypothetical protein